MTSRIQILLGMVALSLAACATSPFEKPTLAQVDRSVSYAQAANTPDSLNNRQVLFGGTIIATRNLARQTEVVVLAYPLDNEDRPDTSAAALGRFIIIQSGYLEPVEYAPGRLLSVVGNLNGVRRESLQGADYKYPVVQAGQSYLWPVTQERGRSGLPSWLNLGIGVGISL